MTKEKGIIIAGKQRYAGMNQILRRINVRILLVGDDVLSPENLRQHLEESFLKAEIVPCASGATAAREAAGNLKIIVIAHMNLPGSEHGLQVLQQVKAANSSACTMLIIRPGLYQDADKSLKEQVEYTVEVPVQGRRFNTLLRKIFRALEDREDMDRRREAFRDMNRSLIKVSEKEKLIRP